MLLRFDAYLNNISFANLDPAIILRDIEEPPPYEEHSESRRALHPGTRITSRTRRSLSVRLIFCVREYDITARASVMDKIAAWAGHGGWLTINSRPGQRLYVTPEEPPSLGSSLKWTADMSLTLTAYDQPYWEHVAPVTSVVSFSGSIRPVGTVPTAYVECTVTNKGNGTMTEVTIACDKTHMTFSGLSVPPGKVLKIEYTQQHLLTITANGESALGNRSAESSDDLIAYAGRSNTLAVIADQEVSALFTARGRTL